MLQDNSPVHLAEHLVQYWNPTFITETKLLGITIYPGHEAIGAVWGITLASFLITFFAIGAEYNYEEPFWTGEETEAVGAWMLGLSALFSIYFYIVWMQTPYGWAVISVQWWPWQWLNWDSSVESLACDALLAIANVFGTGFTTCPF